MSWIERRLAEEEGKGVIVRRPDSEGSCDIKSGEYGDRWLDDIFFAILTGVALPSRGSNVGIMRNRSCKLEQSKDCGGKRVGRKVPPQTSSQPAMVGNDV